jgi:hypothetical protein
VPKPATKPVAGDGVADGAPDHESDAGRGVAAGRSGMDDEAGGTATSAIMDRRGEILSPAYSSLGRQHQPALSRELGASLAATRGDDRSAGACAHAQTEAVRLRAPTVVRLERALAHG